MRNGSATYKAQILRNLAEQSASTTEGLSVLNPDQVEKVRKVNKGKFKQNSRYVAKKNKGTTNPPPPSHKRKARHYDDTESEPEQAVQEAKKGCTRAQRYVGLEAPIVVDLAILSPDRVDGEKGQTGCDAISYFAVLLKLVEEVIESAGGDERSR